MNEERVGKFIKELRMEQHLSQEKLGEIVHVTRQAVSTWETGKSIPDSSVLVELSDLFKVSINEILAGERNAKEDLQEIALKLVDENNQKKSKMRKTKIISSSLVSFLLILFLGYYFINNYNSIRVYTISGKTQNFKIESALMLTTNQKMYIKLDNIKRIKDENISINSMKLLYVDGNEKEHVIFKNQDESRLIKYNYNRELGKNEIIKDNLDRMYLDIEFADNEIERMKLELRADFKNDFFKDKERIKFLKNITENNEDKAIKEILVDRLLTEFADLQSVEEGFLSFFDEIAQLSQDYGFSIVSELLSDKNRNKLLTVLSKRIASWKYVFILLPQ